MFIRQREVEREWKTKTEGLAVFIMPMVKCLTLWLQWQNTESSPKGRMIVYGAPSAEASCLPCFLHLFPSFSRYECWGSKGERESCRSRSVTSSDLNLLLMGIFHFSPVILHIWSLVWYCNYLLREKENNMWLHPDSKGGFLGGSVSESWLCCLGPLATRYHARIIHFLIEIRHSLQTTLMCCYLPCGFSNGTWHFWMVSLRMHWRCFKMQKPFWVNNIPLVWLLLS